MYLMLLLRLIYQLIFIVHKRCTRSDVVLNKFWVTIITILLLLKCINSVYLYTFSFSLKHTTFGEQFYFQESSWLDSYIRTHTHTRSVVDFSKCDNFQSKHYPQTTQQKRAHDFVYLRKEKKKSHWKQTILIIIIIIVPERL